MNNLFISNIKPNIVKYIADDSKYKVIDEEWINEKEFKMILNIDKYMELYEQLEREKEENIYE